MATQIILTVPGGLSDEEKDDLRYLFADALGEFRSSRGPTAAEYVEKRYSHEVYSGLARVRKVEQVARRRALAEKLHSPALHVTFQEKEDDDE